MAQRLPYAIMIAVLSFWIYELRQNHDALVKLNRDWSYSFDQLDNIAMGYRRDLRQIRMSCGRDL